MNVAFDANIWISFTIGKHLAVLQQILLNADLADKIEVHCCSEIIAEYESVMKRPKLRKYANRERVQETLELISRVSKYHVLSSLPDGSRDTKDNYLLALAELIPLDWLVTGDRDLLVLEKWKDTRIIDFSTFKKLAQELET